MLIAGFPAGSWATNCYVVATGPGEPCLVIDPGQDSIDGVHEIIREHRLAPAAVLLTHGHIDHIWSVSPVSTEFGIPALIHADDRYRLVDPAGSSILAAREQLLAMTKNSLELTEPSDVRLFDDQEVLDLAGVRVRVSHAPGHTEGSCVFELDEVMFSGDVLFAGSIGRGEMVAIMGPSGSGKSTLMHILGLLHAPDLDDGPEPALRFDGQDMVRLGDRERTRIRAREMGFVFQEFNLVPTLTALENVMLAGDYAGVKRSQARTDSLDALALVGLADRGGHRPAELSGGEQQRVAIARALVNRPGLVLADEPTGNLDSERSEEVLGMLRRLNADRGQTFVLVTHDHEVGAACDRVVRMRDGRIRDERPAAALAAPGPAPEAVSALAGIGAV